MEFEKKFICHLEALPEDSPEFCLDEVCCGIYKKKSILLKVILWVSFLVFIVSPAFFYVFIYKNKEELTENEDRDESDPKVSTSKKTASSRNYNHAPEKYRPSEDKRSRKDDNEGQECENMIDDSDVKKVSFSPFDNAKKENEKSKVKDMQAGRIPNKTNSIGTLGKRNSPLSKMEPKEIAIENIDPSKEKNLTTDYDNESSLRMSNKTNYNSFGIRGGINSPLNKKEPREISIENIEPSKDKQLSTITIDFDKKRSHSIDGNNKPNGHSTDRILSSSNNRESGMSVKELVSDTNIGKSSKDKSSIALGNKKISDEPVNINIRINMSPRKQSYTSKDSLRDSNKSVTKQSENEHNRSKAGKDKNEFDKIEELENLNKIEELENLNKIEELENLNKAQVQNDVREEDAINNLGMKKRHSKLSNKTSIENLNIRENEKSSEDSLKKMDENVKYPPRKIINKLSLHEDPETSMEENEKEIKSNIKVENASLSGNSEEEIETGLYKKSSSYSKKSQKLSSSSKLITNKGENKAYSKDINKGSIKESTANSVKENLSIDHVSTQNSLPNNKSGKTEEDKSDFRDDGKRDKTHMSEDNSSFEQPLNSYIYLRSEIKSVINEEENETNIKEDIHKERKNEEGGNSNEADIPRDDTGINHVDQDQTININFIDSIKSSLQKVISYDKEEIKEKDSQEMKTGYDIDGKSLTKYEKMKPQRPEVVLPEESPDHIEILKPNQNIKTVEHLNEVNKDGNVPEDSASKTGVNETDNKLRDSDETKIKPLQGIPSLKSDGNESVGSIKGSRVTSKLNPITKENEK